ncbi:hypothetical protein ACFVWU_39010, partial [Kitasatospora sp. NPDC058190]
TSTGTSETGAVEALGLAAGLAVAACGDGVRPQRSTPGGRSSMKQEVVPPQRTRAAAQPRG